MASCFIQNFGCRVNQAEAFSWAEELERGGMRLEQDPARADWVIVNTCTLTSTADRDVRKFVRRIPRINPGAKVVITGCSVEAGRLHGETWGSDVLLLSNAEKKELPERILSRTGSRESGSDVGRSFRTRALLKVQDGCDLRCTYCVIPSVRGPSRSVRRNEVLARARGLIARGFREIVLCGIHLSCFGFDLYPPDSLEGLIRALLELEGMGKVRLSSLDPRTLDKKLLGILTKRNGICPHFHLSFQHASDRILKRMGRGPASGLYGPILERLREASPAAALGADIIVGFPGEEEKDFDELRDFLAKSPLDYLHVFAYSPRPGTPAAGWPQVEEREKRRRSSVLRAFSAERRRAFRERFLGKELDAIVVKRKESEGELLTSNYIAVRVPRCSVRPGGEVKVRITQVEQDWTGGEEAA
ncbi:MAG: MiaB/RimO family radical SAM methylthiotransferase [Candidatus Aminicenantes bacterium]|nr:MiaB/RimO family radical SAM methylthiotransferase [Candidatus Aminicenantes bacterium]